MVPQSVAKDQFYCTVYNITLNSNCEAQGVTKKFVFKEDWVRTEN